MKGIIALQFLQHCPSFHFLPIHFCCLGPSAFCMARDLQLIVTDWLPSPRDQKGHFPSYHLSCHLSTEGCGQKKKKILSAILPYKSEWNVYNLLNSASHYWEKMWCVTQNYLDLLLSALGRRCVCAWVRAHLWLGEEVGRTWGWKCKLGLGE